MAQTVLILVKFQMALIRPQILPPGAHRRMSLSQHAFTMRVWYVELERHYD
jgi:hypothetical protein